MFTTNSQFLIYHRTQQTTLLFMSQYGERRALFHNCLNDLWSRIVFVIVGNIHAMGPKKWLMEPLAHLKITHSIIPFWSIRFSVVWNGNSDRHFFGTSWPLLDWADYLASYFTEKRRSQWDAFNVWYHIYWPVCAWTNPFAI